LRRLFEETIDVAVRGPPGDVHDEPAFVDGEHRASAGGAALEQKIDFALREHDPSALREEPRLLEQC